MKSRNGKRLISGLMVLLMLMLAGTVAFAQSGLDLPSISDVYSPVFPPPPPSEPEPEPEPEHEPEPEPEPEPLENIDDDDVPLEGADYEEVPQTGDDSRILVFGTIGAAAMGGILALDYMKKRKHNDAE